MIVNNVPLLSPVFGRPDSSSVVVVSEEADGAVDVVVVSEDDLWYFEDHEVLVEKVDHEDEIVYSTTN